MYFEAFKGHSDLWLFQTNDRMNRLDFLFAFSYPEFSFTLCMWPETFPIQLGHRKDFILDIHRIILILRTDCAEP